LLGLGEPLHRLDQGICQVRAVVISPRKVHQLVWFCGIAQVQKGFRPAGAGGPPRLVTRDGSRLCGYVVACRFRIRLA
jgi:hypothetical protein